MSILDNVAIRFIERGYYLYKEGRVSNVTEITPNVFEALVQGTLDEPYVVRLDFNNNRNNTCNCPYSNDGAKTCKHQIALYFTLNPSEAIGFEENGLNDEEDDDEGYHDWWGYEEDEDEYMFEDDSNSKKITHTNYSPQYFEIALKSYVDNLDPSNAKEILLEVLKKNPKDTFNDYLYKDYRTLLKQYNKDYAFVDYLSNRVETLIDTEFLYMNDETLNKHILPSRKKKEYYKCNQNPKTRLEIAKILMNKKLLVYKDYSNYLYYIKNNVDDLFNFKQECKFYTSFVKGQRFVINHALLNCLINLHILNDYSLKDAATRLLKYGDIEEYVVYILNHYDNNLLYDAILDELNQHRYKYKDNALFTLLAFVKRNLGDDKYYNNYVLYAFLIDSSAHKLDNVKMNQSEVYSFILSHHPSIYSEIELYKYYNDVDGLWQLVTKKENERFLIGLVEILKEKYNSEMHRIFREEFYNILAKGKKKENYVEACRYAFAIRKLVEGERYLDLLEEELHHSTYQKCPTLFLELDNIRKKKL